MINYGDEGPQFSSWTAFFFLIGVFFLLYFLYDTLKDIFSERKLNKRLGKTSKHLINEFFGSLGFWILLWIPFAGFIWILAKLKL
jgi:hypothetical protein